MWLAELNAFLRGIATNLILNRPFNKHLYEDSAVLLKALCLKVGSGS